MCVIYSDPKHPLNASRVCYFSRERISSCYRLRPSVATPTHLGAKTNTAETREQTRKNTHTYTHTHTLIHLYTRTHSHCESIEAFCFAFKAALYRVFALICFCLFRLFRLVTKVKVCHHPQKGPIFWPLHVWPEQKQQKWLPKNLLFMDNEMEIDGSGSRF